MPDRKAAPKKPQYCTIPALLIWQAVQLSEVVPFASSHNVLNNPWASVGQHWSCPTCTSYTQDGGARSAGVKGRLDPWRAPESQAEQCGQQHITKGKGTTLLLIVVFTSFHATSVAYQGACQELYFRNIRCKAGIRSQGLAVLSTAASLSIHFVPSVFMNKPGDRRSFTSPS